MCVRVYAMHLRYIYPSLFQPISPSLLIILTISLLFVCLSHFSLHQQIWFQELKAADENIKSIHPPKTYSSLCDEEKLPYITASIQMYYQHFFVSNFLASECIIIIFLCVSVLTLDIHRLCESSSVKRETSAMGSSLENNTSTISSNTEK